MKNIELNNGGFKMKKLILALGLLFIMPILSFAWITPSGSTDTPTTADLLIADIINDGWDRVHNAFETYNISTGAYHNRVWVWDSNFNNWIELAVSSANLDDVSVNTRAETVKNLIYGYNGTGWDRLKSDQDHYLWTRTSTNSLIGLYYDGRTAQIFTPNQNGISGSSQTLAVTAYNLGFNGTDWDRLRSDLEDFLFVHTSTTSDMKLYYDGYNAVIDNEGNLQVETDTMSKVGIYYDGFLAQVQADNELRVETSTGSRVTLNYNGKEAQIQSDGELEVEASTDSKVGIYYNGNIAEVQADKELRVETSTDSTSSIYYNSYKAIVDSEGQLKVKTSTDSWVKIDEGTVTIRGGYLDRIINPVTIYMTITQFEELAKFATNYITISQFTELTQHSTWFLNISQFNDLMKNTTNYIYGGYLDKLYSLIEGTICPRGGSIDQIKVVNSILESTGMIKNFPTDYPDSTAQGTLEDILNQSRSSWTIVNKFYSNRVSTGVAGGIDASGTISPAGEVVRASFYAIGGDIKINASNRSGTTTCLEGIPVDFEYPIPLSTPIYSAILPAGTSLYYYIDEVQIP